MMLKLDHSYSGLDAAPVWLDPHGVKEEPGTVLTLNQEPSRDGCQYLDLAGRDARRPRGLDLYPDSRSPLSRSLPRRQISRAPSRARVETAALATLLP